MKFKPGIFFLFYFFYFFHTGVITEQQGRSVSQLLATEVVCLQELVGDFNNLLWGGLKLNIDARKWFICLSSSFSNRQCSSLKLIFFSSASSANFRKVRRVSEYCGPLRKQREQIAMTFSKTLQPRSQALSPLLPHVA